MQQLQLHTLLSLPGKAFTLVLLERINITLRLRWCDNQSGFRAARSTNRRKDRKM